MPCLNQTANRKLLKHPLTSTVHLENRMLASNASFEGGRRGPGPCAPAAQHTKAPPKHGEAPRGNPWTKASEGRCCVCDMCAVRVVCVCVVACCVLVCMCKCVVNPQHAAGMLTVCRSRSGGEGGSSCDEEKEGAGRRIGSEEGERRKAPSRTDLSAAPPRTDLTPSRRLVLILQHLVLSRTISCHCRSVSYRSRSIWHQSRTISHG